MIERYVLGVTGIIGSGKSYYCKKLVEIGNARTIITTHIDFDAIRRVEKNPYDKFRELVQNANGLVLAEWALLVEENLLSTVNYNVLLLRISEDKQMKRLIGGDLPVVELERRIRSQLCTDCKEMAIRNIQKASGQGHFYSFDTSHNPDDAQYTRLFDSIIHTSQLGVRS
jgi:dephospho-CoA kinase